MTHNRRTITIHTNYVVPFVVPCVGTSTDLLKAAVVVGYKCCHIGGESATIAEVKPQYRLINLWIGHGVDQVGRGSSSTVSLLSMETSSSMLPCLPRTGAVPGRLCTLRRLPPRAGEGPTWPVSIRWLCSRCFWKRICYLIFSSVVFTNNRDNLLHRQ